MAYDPEQYIAWIPDYRKVQLEEEISKGLYFGMHRGRMCEDPNGVPAAQAMRDWESNGTPLPFRVRDVAQLARYYEGKIWRDFHVTEWKRGVRDGLFVPEEFLYNLGLDCEQFRSIFGRMPDLRRWRWLQLWPRLVEGRWRSAWLCLTGKALAVGNK